MCLSGEIFDFGLRLKQLRERRHLTPAQLAKAVGLVPATIYRYERNVLTPTLESTIKLAVNLNVSLDYLVGIDNTYTLRLPNLTKKQIEATEAFLEAITSPN